MDYLILGLFGFFLSIFSIILFKVVNRLTETNKQLLIVVAGKDEKSETLRALVASAKPPQGRLQGIAGDKQKKGDKTKNTNYTMSIGLPG